VNGLSLKPVQLHLSVVVTFHKCLEGANLHLLIYNSQK
jgi:hypothetical protein